MFTCYAILGDGRVGLVMEDAGLPPSGPGCLNSPGCRSSPEDVTAVLATHGHSDHVGACRRCWTRRHRALILSGVATTWRGENATKLQGRPNVRFLPMMGNPFK
ncbi:MAG: MBL fold metallo-hydrolase [Candidatus Microthrix sp.]|nr:MBL fold metallo-hydrolase [Candidatus Microthrix sp.]